MMITKNEYDIAKRIADSDAAAVNYGAHEYHMVPTVREAWAKHPELEGLSACVISAGLWMGPGVDLLDRSEHLHPVRPGYLRRGTPVAGGVIVIPGIRATTVRCHHDETTAYGHLDLRDVTARAHAAMPWTEVVSGVGLVEEIARLSDAYTASWAAGGSVHAAAELAIGVLRRMRAMDESVTVDEARGALVWAERVGA